MVPSYRSASDLLKLKNSIAESNQAALAVYQEAEAIRAENYYNCIDEYSYGGRCSQAQSEKYNSIVRRHEMILKQVENGGFLTVESVVTGLRALDTQEIVCQSAIPTRFGMAFNTPTGWVGAAKKASTLQKKGYEMVNITTVYHAVWERFSKNGRPMYSEMEKISETVTPYTGEIQSENYANWFFSTLQK